MLLQIESATALSLRKGTYLSHKILRALKIDQVTQVNRRLGDVFQAGSKLFGFALSFSGIHMSAKQI